MKGFFLCMKLDFRIPNADELFNLNQTEHSALFYEIRETWSVLLRLGDYISSNLKKTELNGEIHDQAVIQGDVSIGEGSQAFIDGMKEGGNMIGTVGVWLFYVSGLLIAVLPLWIKTTD